MSLTPEIIMIASIITIFFITIAIYTVLHARNLKNIKNGDTWLFENWQDGLYDILIKETPENMGQKLGIDVAKYIHNCSLTQNSPKLKAIIIDKLVGYLILLVSLLLSVFTESWVLLIFGALFAIPLISLPILIIDTQVKQKKLQLANELPRFLDLLYTAILIDLPIEQAIKITAKNLPDTIIANEFNRAITDTSLGATSWQTALEKLASDYELDVLSDFVLDIVNAYNNGASILESIGRKAKDIKQSNILTMKERAAKLTNTILLPVLLLKILPVIAIICIPIIQQLNTNGFGL